jgi:hypothetical protein
MLSMKPKFSTYRKENEKRFGQNSVQNVFLNFLKQVKAMKTGFEWLKSYIGLKLV